MTPMEMGYKLVSERHAQFVKDHPNGMIRTNLEYGSDKLVVVKCEVWKERPEKDHYMEPPDGTGMASMPIPGPTPFTKNSEVENAETSALGRALAMIGYHAKDSMASEDEITMKSWGDEAKSSVVMTAEKAARLAGTKATDAMLVKLLVWGKKIFADSADPEKELRKFVAEHTGKRKRADLTFGDIDALFILFKMYESTGGTITKSEVPLDGITDE